MLQNSGLLIHSFLFKFSFVSGAKSRMLAVVVVTGIIPFSRLGGFYANFGSAQIFLPPEKGVFSTNGN